jgi:archaellum component FlaC
MTVDQQTLLVIGSAVLAALGGKEVIAFIVRQVSTTWLKQRSDRADAMLKVETGRQMSDLTTAEKLIEQLRNQNENMSKWLMDMAAGNLQKTADKTESIDLRVADIFTQLDALSRQHQGIFESVERISAILEDRQQYLVAHMENRQQYFMEKPCDDTSKSD